MANIRRYVKNAIKALPSPIDNFLLSTARFIDPVPKTVKQKNAVTFSGRGMTTTSLPPWSNYPDSLSQDVRRLHDSLKEKVSQGEFVLTVYGRDTEGQLRKLDEHLWRHYFIASSVHLSTKLCDSKKKINLVEGGVCDGMGAFFAMGYALRQKSDFGYWAYDSWEAMRRSELMESEMSRAGRYNSLQMNQTRKNLKQFGSRVRYCRGFIPESLSKYPGPSSVHWLHIDLNAAAPSVDMVTHFWDRIPRGGGDSTG